MYQMIYIIQKQAGSHRIAECPPSAVLKNALDTVYKEWNRKPTDASAKREG